MTMLRVSPSLGASRRRIPRVRAAAMFAAAMMAFAAWIILIGWLTGRVLTDRYAWSQWLWFVPTPAAIAAATVGLTLALRPARRTGQTRRRAVAWLAIVIAVTTWMLVVEHRFRRSDGPPDGGVRIAFWNLAFPLERDIASHANALDQLEGDIVILASPADVSWHEDFDHAGEGRTPPRYAQFGLFSVRSTLPIVGSRPIKSDERLIITMVEFDASAMLGRPLFAYLVDLPSEREIPRMELAKRVRDVIVRSGAPEPDIVVGDFNLPRGGASDGVAFPGLRDAFDEAGHDWGATYPRAFPLWHIDRMLVADTLRSLDYDIIDPGVGRHRAQAGTFAVGRPR